MKEKSNKGLIITLSIIGVILAMVIGGVTYVFSCRSTVVELENRIEAQYVANKSNYDSMIKSAMEMVQVSEIQADQFKEVYTDMITGRYDAQEGADKVVSLIKEDNPKLGTEVYTQLQREMSANRKTFDNNQKKISDIVREYNTYVEKKFIVVGGILGKTTKSVDEFVVTSQRTENTFDTGMDEAIDLKGNN